MADNKKFLLISPKNRTVYNFRGDLIREIQKKGYDVTVTGPNRDCIEELEKLNVSFVEVPVNKNGTSILGDLKYCRKLKRLIKEIKPDAVLGYTIKPVVYGTLAARGAGVKNVNCLITGGGYTFTSKSFKARVLGFIVRTLYKFSLSRARSVIFQNGDDKDEFIERKLVKEGKCHVVHGSGVNMQHFTPKPYPERTTFFMLSRLLKSKGVAEYLKAAETVKEKYPDVRFALLGKFETEMQDAVSRDAVQPLIDRSIIELYGETSDVRPYYEDCSVYVLPSYREGTPRTVLEAMAMGRPVITTDTNGCRETVIDGETGFLVPLYDHIALAEKMIFFIENPESVSLLGEKSRMYCEEKFDVRKVNSDMMRIMQI